MSIRRLFLGKRHSNAHKAKAPEAASDRGQELPDTLGSRLEDIVAVINRLLGDSDDFVIRRFRLLGAIPAALFCFPGLSARGDLNVDILKPLMQAEPEMQAAAKSMDPQRLQEFVAHQVLHHNRLSVSSRYSELADAALGGNAVVAVDGLPAAFIIDSSHIEKRSLKQPETEQIVRGPREGFIETLDTNLALIRYRLPTAKLKIKTMRIGRLTKSKVAICYLDGIANPDLVKEAEKRLAEIDIDGILDAGYLEQLIEDKHASPFPQIQNTERPDKVVANLMEGRVALLVNGSPFALIVPSVFSQFYQTAEDYYERSILVSFLRLARLVALIFSLIFPSLYVAIISFNPELIPTEFAVAVAGGRAGVPFPSVIEVLLMEISMEVLREATIRLPQQVGGALSIVGVLVIGQAAVSAGFASPITVVVIALTTIGSFATPAYNAALALRLLRFPLVILAGTFGLYGVMIGLILIVNHMLSLQSFGVPYLSPLVPGSSVGMKDLAVRSPLWSMTKRPAQLHPAEQRRVGENMDEAMQGPRDGPLKPRSN